MTIPPIRAALVLALLFAATATRRLPAQALPQKDCDKAATVVRTGRVSADKMWALLNITACGTFGANAIATGIAKTATETDTARLEDFMGAADNWRDASIFSAATQLANKTSATAQSRVYAIRHLITLLQPLHRFTYADLAANNTPTTGSDGSQEWPGGCRGYMGSEPRGSLTGTPLPASYASQIRATLTALSTSQTAPVAVRNAARCLLTP